MRRRRRKRGRHPIARIAVLLALTAALSLGIWEVFFLRLSALRNSSETRTLRVATVSGQMRRLMVGPQNPYWAPLDGVSPALALCVVKSEDARFFQHGGFDWKELRESVAANLAEGEYARGGSTLTMQLAKNLFLWRGKSLVRKALEAYLTWRLERTLTKRRILELYLNVVEWGPGVYGIGQASRHYFDKPASALTVGESALLAAILPNPVRWSPDRAPQVALRRQQELLARLRRENALSELGVLPFE